MKPDCNENIKNSRINDSQGNEISTHCLKGQSHKHAKADVQCQFKVFKNAGRVIVYQCWREFRNTRICSAVIVMDSDLTLHLRNILI
jgi:hypothetical protein